jgi:hypothetical protein
LEPPLKEAEPPQEARPLASDIKKPSRATTQREEERDKASQLNEGSNGLGVQTPIMKEKPGKTVAEQNQQESVLRYQPIANLPEKKTRRDVEGLKDLLGIRGAAVNWRMWFVFVTSLALSYMAESFTAGGYFSPAFVLRDLFAAMALGFVALIILRKLRNDFIACAITAVCYSLVMWVFNYLFFRFLFGYSDFRLMELMWGICISFALLTGIAFILRWVEWVWLALCVGKVLSQGVITMVYGVGIVPSLISVAVFATVGWAGYWMLRRQSPLDRSAHS